MLQSAIGISDDIDLDVAIKDVISQCREQLGNLSPKVGIFFTSCMDAYFPDLLTTILQAFPDIELVGCTTDGEISPHTGFIEDSMLLVLLASDTLEFATAVATDISRNAEASFRTAYTDACRSLQNKPACAFTFPDGLTTNSTALDEIIQNVFGHTFPVFGGTAGDHSLFSRCFQFHNDQVYSDAAPVLLIAGDVQITSAVRTGPVPTGLSFPLGRHDKNRVYEIDEKTALAFYREHLGNYSETISEFPLAVYENNSTSFYLRDPLQVHEEDESISFVSPFPKQCTVRLTLVSRSDVLQAAEQANLSILDNDHQIDPELIIIFSCTWVRHVLGSRANDKFALLQHHSRKIPFFGFYCYGEIAPFSVETPTRSHNDTYVIVGLSSRNS